MQEWDDLRFFLAIAQTGSVTAASVKLGVNQSTVSRRINNFEKIMNVRLFDRLTTGFQLTPEGKELERRALHIEDEIQAIDRHIMGKNIELSGPIRVTTSIAIARYLLMPIFKKFNKLHPDIQLHLDLSNSIYNLTQREADIAIRVTRDLLPENLIGRKLGNIKFSVYAEKQYLHFYKNNSGKLPLRWIGEDNTKARPNWLSDDIEPLQLVIRSNEVLTTFHAIQQGLGIGRLPNFIGDTEKNLEKLSFDQKISPVPVWLLTHVDMQQIKRMSVFTAFVIEEMRIKLDY